MNIIYYKYGRKWYIGLKFGPVTKLKYAATFKVKNVGPGPVQYKITKKRFELDQIVDKIKYP